MSYRESAQKLAEAAATLKQGQCQQAANYYAAMLTELLPQANPSRPLTPAGTALVIHYAIASRGQSAALLQLGEATPAEAALLTALTRLRGCLLNLGTPLAQRAPLLTEYKLCFYALAEFYFAHSQLDKLNRYVRRHTPDVTRWAADLRVVSATPFCN